MRKSPIYKYRDKINTKKDVTYVIGTSDFSEKFLDEMIFRYGYEEKVFDVQVTSSDEPTVLNAALDHGGNYFAYQVTRCNFYDPYGYPNNFQNNPTEAISALGPPDNVYASLGKGGDIVLDMGCEGEGVIFNQQDDDFTVFEGDLGQDGYYIELRSRKTGHDSYRDIAWGLADEIRDKAPLISKHIRVERVSYPSYLIKSARKWYDVHRRNEK